MRLAYPASLQALHYNYKQPNINITGVKKPNWQETTMPVGYLRAWPKFSTPDNREQQMARAGFETGGTAGLRVTVTMPPLTNTFILLLYCLIS